MSPISRRRTCTTTSTSSGRAFKNHESWPDNSKFTHALNPINNESETETLVSFKNQTYGLPGNSDAGALNSWLVWQMIGLYPVVTQPVYLLSSPWFPDLNMTVNGNRTLRITAAGLGQESYYVQSVKINGQPWTKNWFVHEDVMVEGGTIEFLLGSNATIWETGEVPPSPGHVNLGDVTARK